MEAVCILLIDDDEMVLSIMTDILEDAGFEVCSCKNGKSALAKFKKEPGRFRGLITDINLATDPDGWDIGHKAREISPDLPVIYVSGASGHEWSANGVPNSLMISKPFVGAQIVTGITTLINEASKGVGSA